MGTIRQQGIINTLIIYTGVVIGFLNTIVIQPKFLSVDEVGLTRILISFSGLLTPFFLLGGSSMCVRFFPAFRNDEKRHHGFMGLLLLFPLTGILIGSLIIWMFKERIIASYADESPLFVNYFSHVLPLAAVMTLATSINAYSNSLFKTVFPSFLNDVWVRILLIVFTLLYSFQYISLDWYVNGIVITYFAQLLSIAVYVISVDRPSLKIDFTFVRSVGSGKIISYALLLTLTALSSLSLKFLDTVMIGAYLPLKFVGIYSIGAFIAQFIETPLYALERVAGVKVAAAMETRNMKEVDEIYKQSVKYMLFAGGFLVSGVIVCVQDFLMLLPVEYRGAAIVTVIMSVGSLINMATGVNNPIINNSGKYYYSLIFLFLLLIISVVLNAILIPELGIAGAAIATASAASLYNLMKFIFIYRNFRLQPYNTASLLNILVICISSALFFIIPSAFSPIINILVKGISVTLCYAGLSYMFKIMPDLKMFFRKKQL
ncbi:MAG: hypothetical protein Fur0041_03350 [Bacteroidia bacterium]